MTAQSRLVRRRAGTATAITVALLLAAAATTASAGADTTTPDDTAPAAPSDFALDRPLRIGLLMAVPGEDEPSAVSNGFDGSSMAIEEINAAGGIGGQPVEFFRVSYNINDPAKGRQAFLDALEEDPDILYGAFGGTGVDAIVTSGLLDEAAVPFIVYGTPENRQDSDNGSDWLFQFRSTSRSQAEVATHYAIDELDKSRIGIMYVDAQLGHYGLEGIHAVLDEAGLEAVAEQSHSTTATDLTSSVLAMQSADADIVINWDFPSPLGVQLNQFLQNGLDIPTATGASFASVVNSQLASAEAISANPETFGVQGCIGLSTSDDTATTDWVARYVDTYGYVPDETSTTSYDAIYVIADAAAAAQSVEHEDIREALATGTLHGTGICQPEYHADETGTLSHTATIVGVNGDGLLEARDVIEIP